MAFNIVGFKTIVDGGAISTGDGSVKQVHSYATNDTSNTVLASAYFNSITTYLRKGDLILIHGDVDGTPFSNMAVVSSATGAATVTTTGLATVTQTYVNQNVYNDELSLTDGTYQLCPFVYAGTITKIYTVLRAGA